MKNRQQILGRLARRGWPIIYSRGPLMSWERGNERWKAAPLVDRFVTDDDGVQVHLAGRAVPRLQRFPRYDQFALRHSAWKLRRAARVAGHRDFITFLFNPIYGEIASALDARWLAFHHRDAYEEFSGWSAEMAETFHALNRRADLLTVCAEPLLASIDAESRCKARVLENAADAHLFRAGRDQPCPADLHAIPQPRIGYVGSVSLKMDLPLLDALTTARPDWHWVHIGKVNRNEAGVLGGDAAAEAAWQSLIARPNFHHLGIRPYRSLPAYVARMDVNVLIYRIDGGWARFAMPLKLFEGLATGRPVVSCDLVSLLPYRHVVTCASGVTGWLDAIAAALAGHAPGSEQDRIDAAMSNTWDARVDLLEEWLLQLTAQPSFDASASRAR